MDIPDEDSPRQDPPRDARKERLARQLRANLQRRKAQARSRRDGTPASRMQPDTEGEGDEPEERG